MQNGLPKADVPSIFCKWPTHHYQKRSRVCHKTGRSDESLSSTMVQSVDDDDDDDDDDDCRVGGLILEKGSFTSAIKELIGIGCLLEQVSIL